MYARLYLHVDLLLFLRQVAVESSPAIGRCLLINSDLYFHGSNLVGRSMVGLTILVLTFAANNVQTNKNKIVQRIHSLIYDSLGRFGDICKNDL